MDKRAAVASNALVDAAVFNSMFDQCKRFPSFQPIAAQRCCQRQLLEQMCKQLSSVDKLQLRRVQTSLQRIAVVVFVTLMI